MSVRGLYLQAHFLLDGSLTCPPKNNTGEIEVQVDSFTVLNPASHDMPFYPSDRQTLVGALTQI
jgi:hypothetical protein